ncbi:MAG: hypothetical protein KDC98_09985, partial [Planctomycetes bacterium]|nr:hypothetical protein [Planctomycetota bacterium]
TVVRVRSEIRSAAEAGERQIAVEVEDTIFAFRSDADGDHGSGGGVRSGGCPAPVPTFAIDTPRSPDCPSRAVFRCPPCNYEIGGVAGWLCVPMGRDHAQALEASSFFLLGTDLACDVSVRIDPTPLGEECKPATVNAEELAFAMRQFEPEARTGIAAHWLPSSVAEHPPQGLDGARIRIDLPATDSAPDGNVALFHILQFGTLQHLLLVRGSKAALQDHRAQLDALLDSFRLLQTDLDRSTAAAAPLRHHLGGALDGTSYENITYDVRMTGPEDWQPQQRCGGAAFRIKWTSPAGGFLWLNGYSVPPGMVSWCRDTADRWLHQLCDAAGLALPCQLADWGESTSCEALARTIECRAERELPGARSKRLLHVAFRDDILVIADGSGTTDGEWTAIEHAIATLRL